jgi:Zn-dependent protease
MRQMKVRFSVVERIDLLKAWAATSIAFGIYFMVSAGLGDADLMRFVLFVSFAAVTAGLGFIGHELMHKIAANHFGVEAEFRSHDTMLVISIIIAFFGIIFAAPGAVQIYGHITRKENGIISAAGPAANMVLALLFLPMTFLANPLLSTIGSMGLLVNAILAAFNMIPFWNFDGSKVLPWSKVVYFSMLIIAGALVATAYIIGLA